MKIANGMQEVVAVETKEAMRLLKEVFPTGEANTLNFVLFSTSGVHGTGLAIEEAGTTHDLTFLLIQPRRVMMFFGNVRAKNKADIEYLKRLRVSSQAAVANIGTMYAPEAK